MEVPAQASAEIAARVARHDWYHTLELAPGLVTRGWFDTRPVVDRIPFPADLRGKRCLDVGTFDGFWAFEMERRGAAEVVAIDILDPGRWDWPLVHDPADVEEIGRRKGRGDGFEIAREALGSSVRRDEMSVYDVDEDLLGRFDFVYVGSLLIHLRDPVRAVERLHGVCDGELVVLDNVDLPLTLAHPRRPVAALDGRRRPWWWKLNLAGLVRVVEAGGFEASGRPVRVYMPPGPAQERPPLSARALFDPEVRGPLFKTRVGDPHAALRAVPVR